MPLPAIQTSSTPRQTWSDYILSTYSSSISPTHDPDQYAPSATAITSPTPTTTTVSMSPSSSTTSPWGPYTKSGRGGAGNFTWQSSSSSSPTNPDPDPESGIQQTSLSARQKAAADLSAREQASTLAQKPKAEYTHLGRGGAGNFTPSAEVAPPPSAPEVIDDAPRPRTSSTFSTAVDPYLAARSGYYGRGGAGNYTDSAAEVEETKRREREREREREESLRRQVEESVLIGMRRPEGAVTRERRERGFSRMV